MRKLRRGVPKGWHVVSGNLFLARKGATGRDWTKDKAKAGRFDLSQAERVAARFWGGYVVPA